jgi:hypothetical protein
MLEHACPAVWTEKQEGAVVIVVKWEVDRKCKIAAPGARERKDERATVTCDDYGTRHGGCGFELGKITTGSRI